MMFPFGSFQGRVSVLSLFCGLSAFGGTITFNDLGAPFVNMVGVTGSTAPCTSTGSGSTLLETCVVTLTPPNGPTGANFASWNIFDSDGTLSDTILVTVVLLPSFAVSSATITFMSGEPGSGLTPLVGANTVFEDGTVQTVGEFAWLYGGTSTVRHSIQFQSNDTVPEPSSGMFLAIGLAGLAFAKNHRKK